MDFFFKIYWFPLLLGSLNGWRMPLLFALCTNKTKATYKTIFEQIKKDQPNYCPEQINVDFELAAINAAKDVFPTAKIQGCQFHHAQCVNRNLNSKGLKERYESDITFAKEIREMLGLAYLPPDKVNCVSTSF